MKHSFKVDIAILLIGSIILGSLLSGSVSYAANAYFAKTISSLVGEYGEYDLIIQAREEVKEDTAKQIQRILNEVFPGSKMKEGPTIPGTGKTPFFVTLSDQYKTRETYERLDKIFGSIPGGAGVGFMTEPRLTLRGVPEGARAKVLDDAAKLDGVRFAFRDGANIGVVLQSVDKIASVSDQIKTYLKQYQVVEISFPLGSEPQNSIRTGDSVASQLNAQYPQSAAENVSVSGNKDEMAYMVSTMLELKRFLASYAAVVAIKPAGGGWLKGDVMVFQGKSAKPLLTGAAPEKNNLLVEITAIRPDGMLEGRITQGDAAELTNTQGYKIENNVVSGMGGIASVTNPRQKLGNALAEMAKLTGKLPGMAQDAQVMSGIARSALQNYNQAVDAVGRTLTNLDAAGGAIQAATSGLASIDTGRLELQLDSSAKAMENVINTLEVVRLLQGSISGTLESLRGARGNILSLKSGIQAIGSVAADARQAQASIDRIVTSGHETLAALKSFDTAGALYVLSNIDARVAEVRKLDIPLITAQLEYLAASVPQLKDEEINQSIKLLDKFIAGQVIPSARIQIMVNSSTPADSVTPIVEKEVKHKNFAVYASPLGVIEPNPRGELYQVLLEVRAILAGMTAIVMTAVFLVLDHTAIMAFLRKRRLAAQRPVKGWRKMMRTVLAPFWAPEKRYGMLVGAVVLTAIFLIAKGGIPYLPWLGVPVLGGFIGLVAAQYAEKISPVAIDEVMAGEALGLSMDEIMREIIIPNGRPGLLQKLNARKLKL